MTTELTGWPGVIARGADFVVPFGLGIGTGAFFAVATGATAGSVGLQIYLGLTTAIIAGCAGFIVARLNDKFIDRRRVRRKANVNWMKVAMLRSQLETLLKEMMGVVDAGGPSAAPLYAIAGVMFSIQRTRELGDDPPDFDELIDGAEDFEAAHPAHVAFAFCRKRFTLPPWVTPQDEDAQRNYLSDLLRWDTSFQVVKFSIERLGKWEERLRHFTRQ